MKKYFLKIINPLMATIFALGLIGAQKPAFADDISADGWSTFELTPFRSISIKGDAAKFRALNWMNDGTTGGIKAMGFDGEVGKDVQVSFDGHAIPGDNDFGAGFKLTRKNGGYITMDYGNFRKWYDVYGGFYSNFTGSSSISKLSVDPEMDMGHFFFEIGSNSNILENAPGVSLSYNRDTKEGIKNKLSWGSVVQGVTRKILPSWEEQSLATDTLALTGNTDVAGFSLKGQQLAEFSSGRIFSEDSTSTGSPPPTSFQSHAKEPQTKRLVSSLKADRWIVDDKTYLSFGYQFQHLRNDMADTVRVYNAAGTTTSSGNNRVVDAQASRDSHTWVQHFVTDLTPHLNFITKFKEEVVAQTGTGFAQGYSGGSNRTLESENQIMRTGEAISLRYSGLPKTSLYTDWDFQQTRNWISKIRAGSSYYENLDRNPQTTGTVGVRYVPNSKFNMTSQFRSKSDHNTYNTFTNNDTGITISRVRTESDEWNSRLTWKPAKWLQNSFRLQLLDTVYRVQTSPQYVVDNDWIKSNGNSRIYTYDVSVQPWDEWMFNLGASLNKFKVSTPASQTAVSGGGIPVFVADVYTLLFSTSYAPKENFSLFSSAQYSRANDFNSQGFSGIPYGVNNERYDISLGMKWSPRKDLTLSPRYGYYSYRANPNDNLSMDYGNYSAHVAWLDLTYDWF